MFEWNEGANIGKKVLYVKLDLFMFCCLSLFCCLMAYGLDLFPPPTSGFLFFFLRRKNKKPEVGAGWNYGGFGKFNTVITGYLPVL
jgi:hypothetical protein